MISYCNRRLYKGNSYEICLPITDTGVTSVRFYTSGDIVIEKEGKIVDDTMCFELTKLELDLLPDGVLRYSYADFDSNTKYVIVTPADYSGSTLEDIIADAFESGHTAGEEAQKAKLVSTAITENGTYEREDGFNQVDVNVIEKNVFFPMNPMVVGPNAAKGNSVYIYTTGCKLDPARSTFFQGGNIVTEFGEVEQTSSGNYSVRVNITANPTDKHRFGYISGRFYDTDGNIYFARPCVVNQMAGKENQDYNSGYTAGYDDGLNDCTSGSLDLKANIQGDYYIIPEGTTRIRNHAFVYTSLSSITIPSSVTEIDDEAFKNTRLTGITIPSSVDAIGLMTFAYTNLQEINLPDSVTYLGQAAFANCSSLTAATLPSGLTSIPYSLFSYCALTGITLPTGITSIGQTAFQRNPLTGNIVIPSGVTFIGDSAFDRCSGLTSMTFESPVPATITAPGQFNTPSLGDSGYTWPIYVPCESVEAYRAAWPYYAHRISCQQEPEPEPDYSAMPLTFSILSDGYINWHVNNVTNEPDFQRTIYYSKDSGNTWNSITSTVEGTHIPVLSGETVMFKGDNSKYSEDFENSTKFSGTTCEYDVYGNIMSLINSTGYTSLTALTENFQFFGLFGDTPVRSAEHLILPAMELTRDCYRDLFIRCANLTTAPVLPAQHVPENSYYFMFYCCKHLTYIKCLATSLSANATLFWVGPDMGADVLPRYGTFVKSPDMHDWNIATEENYVTDGIPLGWTVVDDQS